MTWWYYSVELEPGKVERGIYPDDLPMLPRMMLDRCVVRGMDVLDVGSMEGLWATLAAKRGAKVVAVDSSEHCLSKIERVKAAHGVDFEFEVVPHVYQLHRQVSSSDDYGLFDLINLSGLLYHVASPLLVLAGVRPMLRKNAILIVSTNVMVGDGFAEHFNAGAALQNEGNTFWYPTADLLHYWLRLFGLQPFDAMFLPHDKIGEVNLHGERINYATGKRSGYLSIACRAGDVENDFWLQTLARAHDLAVFGGDWSKDESSITAWRAAGAFGHQVIAGAIAEPVISGPSHLLRLADG